MEDILKMTNREIDRLKVIHEVLEKRLKQKHAARQLNLSTRQIRRICKRVRRQGNKGIIHQLRGMASNYQLDPKLKEKAIKRVKERYPDFGPTFANEKLALDGIHLSTNALRTLMIQEEIWKSKPYWAFHRQWRERRSCIGELTQLDGSDHKWFEDRAPRCVLIDYIDDATSKILYMEFVDVEDTLTLMRTTKIYLEKYGRAVAFYVDRDSIYKTTRYPSVEEQLEDKQAQTQFERAMNELGIRIIFAYSAQAKDQAAYCTPLTSCEASFGKSQRYRSRKHLLRLGFGNGPTNGLKRIVPLSSLRTAGSTPSQANLLAVQKCTPN